MLQITEIAEIEHKPERRYQRNTKTRIYVWPKGETLIENLENRKSRPYDLFRKQVIPTVLAQLGVDASTKIRWSQYAGCSCPCSPGFVLDKRLGKDVHVTVTE